MQNSNEVVAVCQFPLSNNGGKPVEYCRVKSSNRFPVGNAGKVSVMNVNMFSAISSLLREPHRLGQAAFDSFKLLKPVFCNLKREFILNLEIKYQRFNVNVGLSVGTDFDPC